MGISPEGWCPWWGSPGKVHVAVHIWVITLTNNLTYILSMEQRKEVNIILEIHEHKINIKLYKVYNS